MPQPRRRRPGSSPPLLESLSSQATDASPNALMSLWIRTDVVATKLTSTDNAATMFITTPAARQTIAVTSWQ